MLPREHGSWALWLVPPLVGLAAADRGFTFEGGLFLAGSLGAFLARVPLQAMFTRSPGPDPGPWLAAYLLLTAAGFAPLVLAFDRWWLLPFGLPAMSAMAVHLRFALERRALSLANELIAIAAMCLGAPAAYYASSGELGAGAWLLWALNVLYFWGPVFHVKTAALRHRCLADAKLGGELRKMAANSILYHAAAGTLVVAAAGAGLLPGLTPLPFLAALGKAWRAALLPPGRADFKSLGYAEVGFAVLFLAVSAASF